MSSVAYAKATVPDEMFTAARVQMETMVAALKSDKMRSSEHGEVESLVQTQGRELERLLYQAHLDLRAACERPVPVRGEDGVERTYRRHSGRPLGTVLGRVMVARLAYQAPDVEGLHPLDGALNLPPELYSHGVCRFVASHASMMPFDDVVGELLLATGAGVGKRQVEEISVRAAVDFEAFYAQRRVGLELLLRHSRGHDVCVHPINAGSLRCRPERVQPVEQAAKPQRRWVSPPRVR